MGLERRQIKRFRACVLWLDRVEDLSWCLFFSLSPLETNSRPCMLAAQREDVAMPVLAAAAVAAVAAWCAFAYQCMDTNFTCTRTHARTRFLFLWRQSMQHREMGPLFSLSQSE